jgi:hypothetical protein
VAFIRRTFGFDHHGVEIGGAFALNAVFPGGFTAFGVHFFVFGREWTTVSTLMMQMTLVGRQIAAAVRLAASERRGHAKHIKRYVQRGLTGVNQSGVIFIAVIFLYDIADLLIKKCTWNNLSGGVVHRLFHGAGQQAVAA